MPIPASALVLPQALDPADVVDFKVTLNRGAATATSFPILDEGESVTSFALAPVADAVAAGLIVKNGSGGYPAPTLIGLELTFWVAIDPALQGSAIFSNAGVSLALELTLTTNTTPPRVKQRTVVIKAANQ